MRYPANLFVAQFVGSPVMNVVNASAAADGGAARVTVDGAADGFAFPASCWRSSTQHKTVNGHLTLGIRPEGVLVSRDGGRRLSCRSRRTSSSRSAPTTSST